MDNVLIAKEGYVYTDGETFGCTIYLGIHDSADNWYEITEEEYEALKDNVSARATEEDYKNALKLVFEAAAVTKNRAIILDAYFVTARAYDQHLRRQIAAQQQAQQDEAK